MEQYIYLLIVLPKAINISLGAVGITLPGKAFVAAVKW